MSFIRLLSNSYKILKNEGLYSLYHKVLYHLKYSKNLNTVYNSYIKQHKLTESSLKNIRDEIGSFKYSPKISIITPVYNVENIWLEKAINSVIDQVYENWELCLVDDGSTKEHIKKTLEKYGLQDERIKVRYLEENQGISGASNQGLTMASGEYIGLLDNDDELPINSLYEVTKLLQEHPDADMIYTDEDLITVKGECIDPFFKPDWSPDMFLSNMYTCHLGVYRKKLIDEIGGFRKGYEGSQDYDLVLRVTEKTDNIYHIPKILYHWRNIPGSTAEKYNAKGYADINARKSLEDALKRRNIHGNVMSGKIPGFFRIKREIMDDPRVSIIIPTKDSIDVLKKCIDSIKKRTAFQNYEIIIINNNSKEVLTLKYLEDISRSPDIKLLEYDKPFNFSAINNFAAQNSNGEYLLFLNNDTEVISDEWVTAMLEHAQRKEVGAVGCKLLYPDNRIQHAGIFLGISGLPGHKGIAGHSHKDSLDTAPGYYGRPHIIQNLSAVTAACLMIRKEVFHEVGGFDERLSIAFNDVDLCLKIREKGYLIVYTPYAILYHYESLSRGYDDSPEKKLKFSKEVNYMREKWGMVIDKGDPYYNPNLSLISEDFRIKL